MCGTHFEYILSQLKKESVPCTHTAHVEKLLAQSSATHRNNMLLSEVSTSGLKYEAYVEVLKSAVLQESA